MTWKERRRFCVSLLSNLWVAGLIVPIGLISFQTTGRAAESIVSAERQLVVPIKQRETVPTFPWQEPLPIYPSYPSFNSQQLEQQFQRYLHYLVEFGPPDILVVGSSRAAQGVDPVALQRLLASRSGRDLKVFNFGINGATAQVVDLILRRLLTPEQLPGLILWADGARAFNSGRTDLTYNGIVASKGYNLLASGTRPILAPEAVAPEEFCIDVPSGFFAAEFFRQRAQANKTLPKDLAVLKIDPKLWCTQQPEQIAESRMSAQAGSIATMTPEPSVQGTTGFRALATQFNPSSYFLRYPKVPGKYDADYRNFSLQGSQAAALDQVLTFAQAQQIPVVFVNLPLTGLYLDEARTRYEQQFRVYMQRFTKAKRLTFYDFSRRWPQRHEFFADPSHLNRYGAAVVSAQLAKELEPLLPQLK